MNKPMQAAVPFVVLAAYHAAAFAAQKYGHTQLWQRYGRRAHAFLASNQVMPVCCCCEMPQLPVHFAAGGFNPHIIEYALDPCQPIL